MTHINLKIQISRNANEFGVEYNPKTHTIDGIQVGGEEFDPYGLFVSTGRLPTIRVITLLEELLRVAGEKYDAAREEYAADVADYWADYQRETR